MFNKDHVYWFAMRVTYGRQLKVSEELKKYGVEHFLPMKHVNKKEHGHVKTKTVPAVSNLIFIHDTMNNITELKHQYGYVSTLRYMVKYSLAHPEFPHKIVTIGECQMEQFMRVCQTDLSQITYLTAEELQHHTQAHVVITSGPFKGVHGVIKRVKKNKCVVIELEGVAGVAINFVPKNFIMVEEPPKQTCEG